MLLGSSILARLPLAMFSIALLVDAQQRTRSFAVAGLVSGAYAVGSAISAPILGGAVDRIGQTTVLVFGSTVTAVILGVDGLLPTGAPHALLIVLGAATGLSTPPVAACVRTLLPAIVAEREQLPALFALESTVLELTFVAGPPLALGLGSIWSPRGALAGSGMVMLAGTLLFAVQPASRLWRPSRQTRRGTSGSLRSPAMRALVVILIGTGAVFGATEVGVTAAARALGSRAAAGPLLGLWGLGSLLGGALATRLSGSARGSNGLTVLLTALALSHSALILAAGSVLALALMIILAGATIAPTVSRIYAMVETAAPPGTQTEAFSWLVSASLVGASMGSAGAGALVQSAGVGPAFALVAGAGAAAVLVALARGRDLYHGAGDRCGARRPVPLGGSRNQVSRAAELTKLLAIPRRRGNTSACAISQE
jgi:predicted MFS family arabinose efflux permease